VMLIGFSFGLPTGSFLALLPGGYRAPFFIGFVFASVSSLFLLLFLPNENALKVTKEEGKGGSSGGGGAKTSAVDEDAWTGSKTVQLVLLSVANLFFQMTAGLILAVFPLFLQDAFGWGAKQLGFILMVNTICGAMVQMFMFGKLSKACGLMPLGIVAVTCNAIALVALSFSAVTLPEYDAEVGIPSAPFVLFMGGLVLQTLVYQMASSVFAPAYSALGGSSVQGRLMGLQSGMEQTGRVLAPIVLTTVYQFLGMGAPFLVAAFTMIIAGVAVFVTFVLQKTESKKVSSLEMR